MVRAIGRSQQRSKALEVDSLQQPAQEVLLGNDRFIQGPFGITGHNQAARWGRVDIQHTRSLLLNRLHCRPRLSSQLRRGFSAVSGRGGVRGWIRNEYYGPV